MDSPETRAGFGMFRETTRTNYRSNNKLGSTENLLSRRGVVSLGSGLLIRTGTNLQSLNFRARLLAGAGKASEKSRNCVCGGILAPLAAWCNTHLCSSPRHICASALNVPATPNSLTTVEACLSCFNIRNHGSRLRRIKRCNCAFLPSVHRRRKLEPLRSASEAMTLPERSSACFAQKVRSKVDAKRSH